MAHQCNVTSAPLDSTDSFWNDDGSITWDWHHIGWATAGACAAACTCISLLNIAMHARSYTDRTQQRQIIRILLMPLVYAITSFLSYRFFRAYTYYTLAETAYEAICIAAFLLFMYHVVDPSGKGKGLKDIDKQHMPFPLSCLRLRPSKPKFEHAIKASVLQYVIIRPGISVIAILCETRNILCQGDYSFHFAALYLDIVDFVSISIALYGLFVFYQLCKHNMKDRHPMRKFLGIKLIVFFTFYQVWLFGLLEDHQVLKGTETWTSRNVADGLSAFCTCVEMFFFSLYMLWAYPASEYRDNRQKVGGPLRASWDAINLIDMFIDLWRSTLYLKHSRRQRQLSVTLSPRDREMVETQNQEPQVKLPIYQEEMAAKVARQAREEAKYRRWEREHGIGP